MNQSNAANSDDRGELWTAFLHDDIDSASEARLIEWLEDDRDFLSAALQDAEVHSLLRELARRERSEDERFVSSVLHQLQSDRSQPKPTRFPVVPPPRVLPLAEDPQPDEPASLANHSFDGDSTIVLRQPVPQAMPDSNARIWWTLVAPLAAVTLIAVTIAIIREPGRVAEEPSLPNSQRSIRPEEIAAQKNSPGATRRDQPNLDATLALSDRPEVATKLTPGSGRNQIATIEPTEGGSDRTGDGGVDARTPMIVGYAKLTGSSADARWYYPPRSNQQGGPLSLQRGSAEFRLADGASIKVTAPVEFAFDSANSLLLARGSVSAHVPARAIGFTVDTPSVQIVDLGTRFETHVSNSGAVRLRVGEGRVRVQSTADTDHDGQSWQVSAGQQKFVESDGTILDWKIAVTADVFGDAAITIDGQTIPVATADDIQRIAETELLNAIRTYPPPESASGRYLFNGQLQDVGEGVDAADVVATDLTALAEIVRRAADQVGAYHVKGRQYPYANLQQQLEARRQVARVYGPRVLGGTFWPRERIETTAGDRSSLEALQQQLIERLDYVNLSGNELQQEPDRRATQDEPGLPADNAQASAAADSPVPVEPQRDELLRLLEQIRVRKGRAVQDAHGIQ